MRRMNRPRPARSLAFASALEENDPWNVNLRPRFATAHLPSDSNRNREPGKEPEHEDINDLAQANAIVHHDRRDMRHIPWRGKLEPLVSLRA